MGLSRFIALVVFFCPARISGLQDRDSVLGDYEHAAVSVDGRPCAEIGTDVLLRDGTAVDAAIATMFCDAVFNPQSTGIGGGFFMTIYTKSTGEVVHLNARETAPSYSFPDMYGDDSSGPKFGPLAGGVPGQVAGFWEAKQAYGNPAVSWESLLQPTVAMCLQGIEVGFTLAKALESSKNNIRLDPGLREIFIDPATGEPWKEGQRFLWETMGTTLDKISNGGAAEFYTGLTGLSLIDDIQEAGGLMSEEDLFDYAPVWGEPTTFDLGDWTVYSSPPPGSGPVLALILNILENYDFLPGADLDPVFYHRLVEAYKWAYGAKTHLGDPADPEITDYINALVANMTSKTYARAAFEKIDDLSTVNDASYYGADVGMPTDAGTAHAAVVAPNGDAVSITSTHNYLFGASFMSPSTGIILNNEMDDFAYPGFGGNGLPPSENNFAKPGKRPVSSMVPTIVVDKSSGDVRLVIGGVGGSVITTSVASSSVRNLWLEEDLKTAIDAKRIHHQLAPMEARYEEEVSQDAVDYLVSVGHEVVSTDLLGYVTGIARGEEDGRLKANSDGRRDGGVDGF